MWKKIFWAWLAMMIAATPPTISAQEVTVEGVGTDRDSATRDAARIAVEQVAGTYINADTLVRDLVVELDEIYKKSQGYIKSIRVISETQAPEGYRVRARVDVDTNPDGKLMNDLAMIYSLNDPRITVIIFQKTSGASNDEFASSAAGNEHSLTAETAMNQKLMSMGFSHVVDAAQVIRLRDAHLLNEIYNGREPLSEVTKDYTIDYLVLGQLESYANAMQVPNFRGDVTNETSMKGARASLACKVLKYSTGDMIGAFQTEGSGMDGVERRATDLAIRTASQSAADELSKTFRKFGSKMTEQIQFIIKVNDFDALEELRREILNLNGVQNVIFREHRNGTAVLDVEATQRANNLLQSLRQRTKLRLFIESVDNNTIQLSIT